MSLKFQYNKTSLQALNKQLNMRLKALPIIKNKETALRIEVKKANKIINQLEEKLNKNIESYSHSAAIWNEFNTQLISIGEVKTSIKKIAGVKIPILEDVIFKIEKFSIFNNPKWFPEGVSVLEELIKIALERKFFIKKKELLGHARRKTTQKVNLFEKVQIPNYEDAIRKIKRFIEDEENLSKSSQKIVKTRQQQQMKKEL